jgi:hypothetical protein
MALSAIIAGLLGWALGYCEGYIEGNTPIYLRDTRDAYTCTAWYRGGEDA